MNRFLKLLAVVSIAFCPAASFAHAMLDHASPKVGSSSSTAPHEVVLWFTENLEPAFSQIEVRNENGTLVSSGKAHLGAGNELRVALKTLSPGTYKVSWHVLSVDTHRTQGDFSFRVES
jgi:copper resistance protein C